VDEHQAFVLCLNDEYSVVTPHVASTQAQSAFVVVATGTTRLASRSQPVAIAAAAS